MLSESKGDYQMIYNLYLALALGSMFCLVVAFVMICEYIYKRDIMEQWNELDNTDGIGADKDEESA
jgi:hypothetical protein